MVAQWKDLIFVQRVQQIIMQHNSNVKYPIVFFFYKCYGECHNNNVQPHENKQRVRKSDYCAEECVRARARTSVLMDNSNSRTEPLLRLCLSLSSFDLRRCDRSKRLFLNWNNFYGNARKMYIYICNRIVLLGMVCNIPAQEISRSRLCRTRAIFIFHISFGLASSFCSELIMRFYETHNPINFFSLWKNGLTRSLETHLLSLQIASERSSRHTHTDTT